MSFGSQGLWQIRFLILLLRVPTYGLRLLWKSVEYLMFTGLNPCNAEIECLL